MTARVHEELAIPTEDGVQDCSSDGRWLLTASSRNARIGWQLYVMRTDGEGGRRITEKGNPFYARFSPDARKVLVHRPRPPGAIGHLGGRR